MDTADPRVVATIPVAAMFQHTAPRLTMRPKTAEGEEAGIMGAETIRVARINVGTMEAGINARMIEVQRRVTLETLPDIPKHPTFTPTIGGSGTIQGPTTRIITLIVRGLTVTLPGDLDLAMNIA